MTQASSPAPGPTAGAPQREADLELLARRYGEQPSPEQRRRTRVVVASVSAVLGLAVVVWLSLGLLRPGVEARDVGFTVHDETSIEVVFDVTMAPGATATCTIEALNTAFGQIGLLDVEVGPSQSDTVRVTVDVATTELATTGVVRDCVLAG